MAVLGLFLASASATGKEHALDFCPPGGLGGQCNGPRGVAVNQAGHGGVAAGTTYVTDFGNGRIQSFDVEGNFIRAWGADVVSGGGTGFEVCEVAAECKAGVSGGAAGAFNGIAGGIAVGQTTGDVYVIDRNNFRVQQFSATGAFIRAWGADVTAGGGTGFEVCEIAAECKAGISGTGAGMFGSTGALVGIAADTSGSVYVSDAFNRRVQKFSAEGQPLRAAGWDVVESGPGNHPEGKFEICVPADGDVCKQGESGSDPECQFTGNNPGQLTASPAGDLYAVNTSPAKVVRLKSSLECVEGEFAKDIVEVEGGGQPRGVAVNPVDGNLFLAKANDETIYEIDDISEELVELTPAGASNWFGLAIDAGSGRLFATASSVLGSGNWLRAFDATFSATTLSATEIGAGQVTLNGLVNPAGSQVAECFFEYDTLPYEGGEAPHGERADCEEPDTAEIGAGGSPVAVHAKAEGLNAGTIYHFRLVAVSAEPGFGQAQGAQQTLQTLGPAIEATWAEDVGFTEAGLRAAVNPEGKATTFRFQYGDQGPCSANSCTSIPSPEGEVGEGFESQRVGTVLENLEPDTTYHYRILTTDSDDVTSVGPNLEFDTYAHLDQLPCANEAFRTGPSAALPDCRAHEMVSPLDKGGGDIVAKLSFDAGREAAFSQASTDGNRSTYTSTTAFGDAQRGAIANQYLSSRGESGWSTHGVNPPQGETVFDPSEALQYDLDINFQAFSADLCLALLKDQNLAPLTFDAIDGFTNLYLRDNCEPGAGDYRALTTDPVPTISFNARDLGLAYASLSEDGKHAVFGANAALGSSPEAAEATNLQIYDRDLVTGQLRLVSVLPSGEATTDPATVGAPDGGPSHDRISPLDVAVSDDASRIYWIAAGDLYVRLREEAETLLVATGGQFLTASADGSKAIFRVGGELLEFDVDKALAEEEATTLVAGEAGGVVGASDDLLRLYFTSKEAIAGSGENERGDTAKDGEWNLYLRSEGTVEFIAMLSSADRGPGSGIDASAPIENSSRVTPDGHYLAFMSTRPLTGYDNIDQETADAASEAFLYDAESEGLICASCNPSGARPAGGKAPIPYKGPNAFAGLQVATWLPTCEWANHCKRSLSESGDRLLFNSYDALVPEDINGAQDLYQWEAAGTGSCGVSDPRYFEANEGCIHLISTGRSASKSELLDASSDGSDVFVVTHSSIHPEDRGLVDVYDARIGGGFPPPPPSPLTCEGDSCQAVPDPPPAQSPASALYAGPGNLRAGCARHGRRARAQSRRAKQKRRAVRRSGSAQRSRRLRREAKRLARRATGASRRAKRCRRVERRSP